MTPENDLSPFTNAMAELGIDANKLDNDPVEYPEDVQAENPEAAAGEQGSEEAEAEESDLESEQESEQKPEGDENNEAPIEEPKLTAKEFQEIESQKKALESEKIALTEERQKLETEFKQRFEEHNTKLMEHQVYDDFLAHLAEKDPALYELIEAEFKEHHKQYSNPVMQRMNSELSELKKELGQFKNRASDEVTIVKMNTEIEKVKNSIGKEAETLGLKVDYKALEDVWADNGKLSFEDAFYAKYGAAMVRAAASKAKVSTAENISKARPAVNTSGVVKKSNAPAIKDYSRMNAIDILKEEARNYRAS
jgi:CRISPR/Cas system-associated endoribonuclease Cas2